MNKAELLLWLHRFVLLNFKTNRNFCRFFDIGEQHLSEIFRGRRPIPKRLLRSLNIKTITTYQLGTSVGDRSATMKRPLIKRFLDSYPGLEPAPIMEEAAACIEDLAAALKPFAALAFSYDPPEDDDNEIVWNYSASPKLSDLRKARSTLERWGLK